MADRLFIGNDATTGYGFDEKIITFPVLTNEASVHVASANSLIPVWTAPANGRVTDFYISVVNVALSASGFVSGTVSADLRRNSASVLSTTPGIAGPVATSALVVRQCTLGPSAANITSAVVNAASAAFSAGDQFAINWTMQSGASAAAGAAGKGFVVSMKVRMAAN